MTDVLVCGIQGRMGQTVAHAVAGAPDLQLACGVDPQCKEGSLDVDGQDVAVYASLDEALRHIHPDVMVDFTRPDVVEGNLRAAMAAGVNCVVGTTGLSEGLLAEIAQTATQGAALFHAPNFTTGAVLMMQFAKQAAKFFPDMEIIELHHDGKADAPSGTAIRTAHLMASARSEQSKAPGKETELAGMEGARGALVDGIPVHSVRTVGYVAHQEVILGSSGQTLTIRHDSIDRTSYMPGVLLACRKVEALCGLVIGLEKLMED